MHAYKYASRNGTTNNQEALIITKTIIKYHVGTLDGGEMGAKRRGLTLERTSQTLKYTLL